MATYSQVDLPILHKVSDTLGNMIQHANIMKAHSDDLGDLIAIATVLDRLQTDYDKIRGSIRKLSK